MLCCDIMGTNNTRDVEKGSIFNRDDRRNPATKGSAKRNRPYIITNQLSFVITKVCIRDFSQSSSSPPQHNTHPAWVKGKRAIFVTFVPPFIYVVRIDARHKFPWPPPHWHFGHHQNPFKVMNTAPLTQHWHHTDSLVSKSVWARKLNRKSSYL